jgi:hypothetical protein
LLGPVRYGPWLMSDIEKRLKDAARELIDNPLLNAIAVLFGGLAPDMDLITLNALRDDNVRLYQMIRDGLAALDDEARRRINAEEAMELAIQTYHNMGRTVLRDKRAQMITVCVHGILRPDDDAAEKRLFVRAIADLDTSHVAMLKRAHESSFHGALIARPIQRSLITELIARGFMQRTEKKPDLRNRESLESLYDALKREREDGDRWTIYSLTALGQRFVHHLQGTTPQPREPGGYVLKDPDPLP